MPKTTQDAARVEHFGERLRQSQFGHKMTRALYAYPSRAPHQRLGRELVGEQMWQDIAWAYRDDAQTQHSDAYLLIQRDSALVNFDLSMRYFDSLDDGDFNTALQHVLTTVPTFQPVDSLRGWDGVAGAYVMVFDEYRQFYVGQSNDIRTRIKRHWSGRKSFDRLLFGTKYDSILPVDELRALDTTRIYAAKSRNPHAVEQRAEQAADRRYCLNRMSGGEASAMLLTLTALSPPRRTLTTAHGNLTIEGFDKAHDEVTAAIADLTGGAPDAMSRLTDMDRSIFSVTRDSGSQFMWSRRDAVLGAAARGDLSVDDLATYLTRIGEQVIWLKD